jgi:glycosyltransferase involved in cell wall biosynthesis
VILTGSYSGEAADILIALHADKSRDAAFQFLETNPGGKLILALTGTDIYPQPGTGAVELIRRADALITLQRKAGLQIPEDCREKVVTVIQSAECLAERRECAPPTFDICVVGHFRDVKDPLLTAKAVRRLSASSKVRLRHAGGILDDKYAALVAREEKENPRYEWLGELSEIETARLLASSKLMVLTSLSEGGARVVGESIVHGTPVLSTRIDGVIGLLGEDYPGFFPIGDAVALAALLELCENDEAFYSRLTGEALACAGQFHPAREKSALLAAIESAGKLSPES